MWEIAATSWILESLLMSFELQGGEARGGQEGGNVGEQGRAQASRQWQGISMRVTHPIPNDSKSQHIQTPKINHDAWMPTIMRWLS